MKAIRRLNRTKYVSIISFCLLTACAPPKSTFEAPLPKAPADEKTSATKPEQKTQPAARKPDQLTAWELSGAIATKHNKKGWTATLNWLQQGPNQYQIRLLGPLGGGAVSIEKQGSLITFRDGPKKITSTKADALLEQQTGIRLPVGNLYYWVRGIPAPGAIQSSQHDQNAHLTSLNQAGYLIDYTGYTSSGGMDLPSKIRLVGHDIIIKLIIKHWQIQ